MIIKLDAFTEDLPESCGQKIDKIIFIFLIVKICRKRESQFLILEAYRLCTSEPGGSTSLPDIVADDFKAFSPFYVKVFCHVGGLKRDYKITSKKA